MPILPSINAGTKGAVVPIGYVNLSSSASNINFSTIPQNYQDLFLVVYTRTDYTTAGAGISCYFNNASSTANYSQTTLYGNGSSM